MKKESVWDRRARKVRAAKAAAQSGVAPDCNQDLAGGASPEPIASRASPIIEVASVRRLAAGEEAETALTQDTPVEAIEAENLTAAEPASARMRWRSRKGPNVNAESPAVAPNEEPAPSTRSIASIQLPEILDLQAAGPLTKQLLERRGAAIIIDAEPVKRLGAQCAQVLLSAARSWRLDRSSLSLVNPSPEMLEDLHTLGLEAAALQSGAPTQ